MARTIRMIGAQLVLVAALLAVWEWLAATRRISSFVLGRPSRIAEQFGEWLSSGDLVSDVGATLLVLGSGYLIGLATGALLGALLGLSDTARAILEPFVVFFNGMPRLLLYPLLVVTLGFGFASKVTLVVLAVVVLVAVTIAAGFREIPRDLLDNMRLMGADRRQLTRQVYLPSLTLWILSTSRTTIGYAFSATILAEFVGAIHGIGYRVVAGQAALDVNTIWAAILAVVIVTLVVYSVIGVVERRATRWLPTR